MTPYLCRYPRDGEFGPFFRAISSLLVAAMVLQGLPAWAWAATEVIHRVTAPNEVEHDATTPQPSRPAKGHQPTSGGAVSAPPNQALARTPVRVPVLPALYPLGAALWAVSVGQLLPPLGAGVDNGASSPAGSIATADFVDLEACLTLVARAKPGKVQLTWSPLPGVERFDVYRSAEARPSEFVKVGEAPPSSWAYLDETVPNEVTLLYVVCAVFADGVCYSTVTSTHPTVQRGRRNYSPVIYSVAPESGQVGVPFNYHIRATDPNGDVIEYGLVTGPDGMEVAHDTGRLTWRPTAPGSYSVTVGVLDGNGGAATQAFEITVAPAPNRPPVANAGPDQIVFVAQTVTLDGSQSGDTDGDPLTFSWSFSEIPPGSAAALSDPTAVEPIFTVDLPGTYTVQLVVNDGFADSAPDSVTITTENSAPIANAGPDQTVFVNQMVTSDGSRSSDVDGNVLTYKWSFTELPSGSGAVLSDPTTVKPTFVADKYGTYTLRLVVNDGLVDSAPDTVTISTENSAPVANAGPDQTVFVTQTATLDGSQSSDVDGNALTYQWSFISRPAGSTASLSDPTAVKPMFVVDKFGEYTVQLIVNDGLVDSAPASVTISTENSKPVANAGPDQTVHLRGVAESRINFDDYPAGPLTFAAETRYLSEGALFSRPIPIYSVAVLEAQWWVDLYVAGGGTLPNTMGLSPALDSRRSIELYFVFPGTSTPATTDYFKVLCLDSEVGSTLCRLEAFDSEGNLIASTSPITPASSAAVIEFQTPGIAAVRFTDLDDGFEVDNIVFHTPSPATTVTLDGSQSSDVDGNALTYQWSFMNRPAGSTATLSDPTAVGPTFTVDKAGSYVIQLIVNDGLVNSDPQTVTISTENSKPVANAGPNQKVTAGDTVTLDGSGSSDADLDPLTYAWSITSKPTGSSSTLSDPTAVIPTFVTDLAGDYVVQLIVNDSLENSAPDTVTVTASAKQVVVPDVVGLTQAAAQSSLLAAQLTIGTVTTANSDTVPADHVISQSPMAGTSVVTGSPVDLVVSLGPSLVQVPDVVGLPQAAAEAAILAAQLTVGTVTSANDPTIPAGSVISQNPAAAASVAKDSAVALVISLGNGTPVLVSIEVTPADLTLDGGKTQQYAAIGTWSDGSTQDVTATALWNSSEIPVANITPAGVAVALDPGTTTISATQDGVSGNTSLTVSAPALASIVLNPLNPTILVNQSLAITATGVLTDGTSVPLTSLVTWTTDDAAAAAISAAGILTGVAEGKAGISAIKDGVTASTLVSVQARVTDPTWPTAQITAPANDATLTSQADVIGTASDANFSSYVLEYALAGDNTFTKFGEGTAPVVNGVLGRFDPTVLLNDLYTVRLTVTDRAGNITSTAVTYQVARDQKVGIFSLTFQDLNVPVSGLPITVNRVYDSRFKGRGDFGIGWRLDIQTMKASANRVQGTGWQVNKSGGFLPTYTLVGADQHKISITLPDGKVEEFDLTPTPSRSTLLPFQNVTAAYTARSGTLGTLAPLGSTDLWIFDAQPGPVELLQLSDLEPYDPQTFQYTGADGTVFTISKSAGVQGVRDLNGNTLTFGPNGVTHSSGKGIAFLRDGQGRITQITDPNGNVQRYAYDVNGDLSSHTDALNNTSRYFYNLSHGLLEIRDPRGLRPVRNEYDDQGRIVAHVDAAGNRIEYTHNVGARQELVTDRLGRVTLFNYDTQGNVLSQTDAMGNTKSFTYDARGNKLTDTDPLGNTTTSTYDTRNNILTQRDPLGNVTTFTYNAQNQVLTTTDALGRVTANTYDARGNVLTTTDPLGNVTTHTYDARGNQLTTTDALGQTTTFQYDGAGNVTRETNPLGHVTTYTYDNNGNRLSETKTRTDENGNPVTVTTTSAYDARNRLIRTTDTYGNSSLIEYDAAGKQSATTDKLGNRTTYLYEARGNLTQTTFPDGTTETRAYDAEGNLTATTDREGRTTQYEYDALNRLTKTTFPDGAFTQTQYDAAGHQIAVIDERGNQTSYEYDAAGRNTRVLDALGNVSTYVYNAIGQRTQFTDAKGNTTTYQYDAAGRRTRVTWANGNHVDTEYNALGQRTAVTDEAGKRTRYAYDALGRLIRVTDPLGGITQYGYDESGNRITQTDANGHTTRFAYDSLGRMVKRTLPLGMAEALEYDALGNLIAKTDFNGDTITFAYDVNRRITGKLYPDGSQVTFNYTPTGQRQAATSARGQTTYQYDARDRLLAVVDPRGLNTSYAYDTHGNRTALTVPSGTTTFTFDALNRLESVTDTTGGIATYTYDQVGNRARVTYPNGTFAIYGYDALNRLTTLSNLTSTASTISSYTYTLGPRGNRTRVVEQSGRTVDYTYDDLARLTVEDIVDPALGNQTIGYTYDPVGNRLTKMDASGINAYAYDANDRLLTEGGNTYTYDNNGSTLSRTDAGGNIVVYGYDFENRLKTANSTGQALAYEYDEDGLRISSSVNGTATQYLVDKNRDYAQVLEERSNAGALIVSYVHGDDLISQHRTGTLSYYHYDGHGSTRSLSDTAETVTDTYAFDAFGVLLHNSGSTQNNYLYSGEQYDPNAGFYYLRARYYNPQIGRFLSIDFNTGHVFDPLSLHKYLYAHCNPVNSIDPTGLETLSLAEFSVSIAIANILASISIPKLTAVLTIVAVTLLVAVGLQTIEQVRQATQAKSRDLARTREAVKENVERLRNQKKDRLLFHYTGDEYTAKEILATATLDRGPASGPYPPGAYATSLEGWAVESILRRSQLVEIIFGRNTPANYARTAWFVAFLEHPRYPFKKIAPFIYWHPDSPTIIPLVASPNLLGE